MHRSGTSVLTHVLSLLGAQVGDDLLAAEEEINAKGFWEHRRVVELNERLFQALDRTWYDFLPLPDRWQERARIKALEEEAVEFLEQELGEGEIAAIKDPRLCLFLPFWVSAARRAGRSPRVILALRNPLEVAASLCRRDPLDRATATLLWLRYTRDAERHSRTLPRVTVDYEQLLHATPDFLVQMGEHLGVSWTRSPEEAGQAIDEAIDPALRHQRGDSGRDPLELAALAMEIHARLASPTHPGTELDGLWLRFDDLLRRCQAMTDALTENTHHLFALDRRHRELGGEHARALEVIAERDRLLGERTREWEAMGKELEYCRSVVEERDGQLHGLNEKIDLLRKESQQVHRQHEELVEVHENLREAYRRLDQEHQALISHPLIRVVMKLFLREEKWKDNP